MKRVVTAVIASLLVIAIFGCSREKSPTTASGKMTATADFTKYFGVPPAAEKGHAYAFVIYFPSAKHQGELVPLPFFTFEEQSMKKVALQRLMAGMEVGSYRSQLLPFPKDSRILSIEETAGAVTANFNKEASSAFETGKAFSEAAGLTLRQFKSVQVVNIQGDGKTLPSATRAANRHGVPVRQQEPRLLTVTAMRDEGAKDVEEVDVFFDRPVSVKELKIMSQDGRDFSGDIYHSVFDMAAVLKPATPSEFVENMTVKIRWKVVDKLGRESKGEEDRILEVKQHEE